MLIKSLLRAALWAGLAATASVHAERLPVLKQIDLPHPYYYREMYLPQLTSGPSSLAWSPDSKELIYSMAGSLWRQAVGTGVAQQLTAAAGYDYQPDWSADGRWVIYSSYRGDSVELWAFDLATGAADSMRRRAPGSMVTMGSIGASVPSRRTTFMRRVSSGSTYHRVS